MVALWQIILGIFSNFPGGVYHRNLWNHVGAIAPRSTKVDIQEASAFSPADRTWAKLLVRRGLVIRDLFTSILVIRPITRAGRVVVFMPTRPTVSVVGSHIRRHPLLPPEPVAHHAADSSEDEHQQDETQEEAETGEEHPGTCVGGEVAPTGGVN